jgi:hypothetical protein
LPFAIVFLAMLFISPANQSSTPKARDFFTTSEARAPVRD